MKTTAEQRAALRRLCTSNEGEALPGDTDAAAGASEDVTLDLLDDLDEALAELAALRAVAEAARDAAECDGHAECCNTTLLAEQRGKAKGLPDSDVWDETECDCAAGRTRVALRAALRAWEERER